MQYKQNWFHIYWRPAIAWSYLLICLFDFIGGPIMFAIYYEAIDKTILWSPLTLRGGGIYHASMLAIIGVTSWGRTQEKINSMMNSNPPDEQNTIIYRSGPSIQSTITTQGQQTSNTP